MMKKSKDEQNKPRKQMKQKEVYLSLDGHIYIQLKKIGSGSYSSVYSVRRDDGKEFAFKKFKREEEDTELGVLREISLLRLLKNTNQGLINLEDIVISNKHLIGIIMEKYDMSLYKAIRKKLLTFDQKIKIAFSLLKSVAFLHANGILHRDIKPENVLLDKDMNPILTDFTLSRLCHSSDETTHSCKVGTCTYRPPEVIRKHPYSYGMDIWSLGVVFFELFTGKLLTTLKDKETIEYLKDYMILWGNYPLERLIKEMLRTNKSKRISAIDCLLKYNNKLWKVPKNIDLTPDNHIKLYYQSLEKNLGLEPIPISNKILKLCKEFEIHQELSKYAAYIFSQKTKYPNIYCVMLAGKLYEPELVDYTNEEGFTEKEFEILCAMDFNVMLELPYENYKCIKN